MAWGSTPYRSFVVPGTAVAHGEGEEDYPMATTSFTALVPSVADHSPTHGGRSTMLLVQWALALACIYMVLFSEQSRGVAGWGSLVVIAFLVTNLAIGRLEGAITNRRSFMATVGFIDAVLIIASLTSAGQLSVELVLLCLGIVILAVAGLRLPTIAVASMVMTVTYLLIVGFTDESPWRTGTLLRLPFLFIAAVVYAWFVEVGTEARSTAPDASNDLASQRAAIERCRQALGTGAMGAAEKALAEIEQRTQALERALVRA
jgi:hypothetical protein